MCARETARELFGKGVECRHGHAPPLRRERKSWIEATPRSLAGNHSAVAFMPAAAEEGGFLTGLGFAGAEWLWPLAIPLLAAIVALVATRAAAYRTLRTVR